MANGLVPVGAGWRGAGGCCCCCCCWGCCCGGGPCWRGEADWKGELEVGAAKGWAACGEERAKGLVDWVEALRWGPLVLEVGLAAEKVEPVCCWSMDWRKGLVVCCGERPWKPGAAPVWKEATESWGIGPRELGWKPGWGEKPP